MSIKLYLSTVFQLSAIQLSDRFLIHNPSDQHANRQFLCSRPLPSGRRASRTTTNGPAVHKQPFPARQPGDMREPIGVNAAGTAVRLLPSELRQRGE